MKKIITILLFIAGLTANAQGTWSTGVREADELRGTPEATYYQYDVEGMGSFILFDWEDWTFYIFTDKGVFDVDPSNSGSLSIIMGLYTPDGKLLDRLETTIAADYTKRTMAWVNKDWWYLHSPKKTIKKMLHALKDGEGYVRIVCNRKGMQDFDITITKYDISEENSTAYIEYKQILNNSTLFYDINDYSTPEELNTAVKNKTLNGTTLKKGERFKVLSMDWQSMSAKVQLPSGKVGWIYALHVPDKRDFISHLPFRNIFLSNIDTKTVVPGMTREEFFIVTGSYLSPRDKLYKELGDYIWYNYTAGTNYLFYKNSLYFATSCNGAFYYQSFVNYKLTNVSRNESVMDNCIISSTTKNYKDEFLSISWIIDRNKVNFTVKNNASSSIKILWDDMAFVGLNGESHRIIHKGIKFVEKEKEQAPSIIARNAELHDLIIPADNLYYQNSWEKWSAHPFVDDFLYSPEDESTKHPDGKKIQVLLPVIVNEKRYEYQFVFEIENISFKLMNHDYYKESRVPDEL